MGRRPGDGGSGKASPENPVTLRITFSEVYKAKPEWDFLQGVLIRGNGVTIGRMLLYDHCQKGQHEGDSGFWCLHTECFDVLDLPERERRFYWLDEALRSVGKSFLQRIAGPYDRQCIECREYVPRTSLMQNMPVRVCPDCYDVEKHHWETNRWKDHPDNPWKEYRGRKNA